MKVITTVFLSYSQKDRVLKNKIQAALTKLFGDYAKIISDDDANRGGQVHEEISNLINQSDILIPIITNNWLHSHETRDESVRAHERKRRILPLVKIDKEDSNSEQKINENELPYYMRETLRYHFTEENYIEELVDLANAIKLFDDHWKKKLIGDLTQISNHLTHDKPHNRKIEYATQEIGHLKGDIEKVFILDQFKKNVSYESNFLTQAIPFFKTAEKIYAISFVKISSFWLSSMTKEAVITYLEKQSHGDNKIIFRLFVFENPDEANNFKNILTANYKSYGKNGGVFLCSLDTYSNIIKKLSGQQEIDKWLKSDFGLLIYKPGETYLATLDPEDFFIGRCHLSQSRFYRNFVNFVDDELFPMTDGDEREGVTRWAEAFTKSANSHLWASALKSIFPKRYGRVTHLILFKLTNRQKEVFDKLLFLKKALSDLPGRRKFVMLTIDVLSKINDVHAIDGKYFSRLEVCKDYDYAIIEVFPSQIDLENYYYNEVHSSERKELYEIINPAIKTHFNDIEALNPKDEERIREIYNKIELEMKNYMTRIDFKDELPIEYIANQEGIDFSL